MRVSAKFVALSEDQMTLDTELWTGDKSTALAVRNNQEIPEKVKELEGMLKIINEEIMRFRSDWVLDTIYHTNLIIDRYKPSRGNGDIQLPECLQNNKAIISPEGVKNNDCGRWAIIMGLHYKDVKNHRNRVSTYTRFKDEIVLEKNNKKVEFPMRCPNDIETIEKLNPWLSVNVYRAILEKQDPNMKQVKGKQKLHKDQLYLDDLMPLRVSKQMKEHHVDLLLYENTENTHYCLITDLEQLYAKQGKRKVYVCRNCLQQFTVKEHRDYHLENNRCLDNDSALPVLPKKGKHHLKFSNYHKQLRLPFVIYCDLESDLINYTQQQKDNEADSTFKNSSKNFEQEHIPNSIAAQVVSTISGYNETVVFYNNEEETCIQQYVKWLLKKEKKFSYKVRFTNEPIKMTEEDEEDFQNATHCSICHREGFPNGHKVRDHCHLTGKYRGASCNGCNLNKKLIDRFHIPVIFHNLKNYDSHLIIKELVENQDDKFKKFNALPSNTETFITFSLGNLSFIDSFAFLGAGLETLVDNLKSKGDNTLFKNLRS
jgi:hypothetical protein